MRDLTEIGLVLQGGGALGAYEYGAVQALLGNGYVPTVVSGVSIGAVNAAVLAGAQGPLPDPAADRQAFLGALRDNMLAGIDRMWARLTMPDNPFLPAGQQALLSVLGNPSFWALRRDWFDAAMWTNYYDVRPMYATLGDIVDFGRINAENPPVRIAVTATCIETGGNTRFANYDPQRTADGMADMMQAAGDGPRDAGPLGTIKARSRIGPEHVMASGALPPSFPGVRIEGRTYWDGGLFDNTPIRPLIEMLTPAEADGLPIVVVNLFPHMSPVPTDLLGVSDRMMAIQYQSRFADAAGSYDGLIQYGTALGTLLDVSTRVLAHLRDDDAGLAAEISDLKADGQFQRLLLYRAFRNVIIVPALTDFTQIGPMDFSAYGIEMRRAAGFGAVATRLEDNGGRLDAREAAIVGRRPADRA